MKFSFIIAIILISSFSCKLLYAQQPENEPGRVIENFPYPYKKMGFISPRYNRTNYSGSDFFQKYNIRAFATTQRKYHFRADLPLANTNMTAGGQNSFGLGDMNFRFAYTFAEKKRFFFSYAINVVIPTASSIYLGEGKWQAHPSIGAVYFKPKEKGSISFVTEYRFVFAGQDTSRPNVRRLAFIPNIDWWFKRWSIGYYGTLIYDFESDVFDLPLDIEGGYFLDKKNKILLSTEFILPLLKQKTYNNEFAVKLRFKI